MYPPSFFILKNESNHTWAKFSSRHRRQASNFDRVYCHYYLRPWFSLLCFNAYLIILYPNVKTVKNNKPHFCKLSVDFVIFFRYNELDFDKM